MPFIESSKESTYELLDAAQFPITGILYDSIWESISMFERSSHKRIEKRAYMISII
jgi:hypothetical protein